MDTTRVVKQKKKNFMDLFIDKIEKYGNKLPEPMMIFAGLSLAIVLISYFASLANLSAFILSL